MISQHNYILSEWNMFRIAKSITITSHPFCEGGGLLKAGLPSLRKVHLRTPVPALD